MCIRDRYRAYTGLRLRHIGKTNPQCGTVQFCFHSGRLTFSARTGFRALGGHFGIARSVRLSVPWRGCLGFRHAGCLQLSHRRPPEMCRLRTRPRTDVDPPRFLPPSNCHRREGISSHRPRGDTLFTHGTFYHHLYTKFEDMNFTFLTQMGKMKEKISNLGI